MNSILACLCDAEGQPPAPKYRNTSGPSIIDEKPKLTPPPRSAESIATEVVSLLRAAEKGNATIFARQLDDIVGVQGWTEWIAENVVRGIETVIREGKEKLGPVMAEAYEKATAAADAAFAFSKEHPLATAGLLTIVAVGILVVLAPVIVETLGFAELGPVESELRLHFRDPSFPSRMRVNLASGNRLVCCLVGEHLCGLHPQGLAVLLLPASRYDLGTCLKACHLAGNPPRTSVQCCALVGLFEVLLLVVVGAKRKHSLCSACITCLACMLLGIVDRDKGNVPR